MNDIINMVKHMRRLSGILLHPTSLPGDFGIGDLGPAAYRFVDFLEASGQHLWQTLPLGPTGDTACPYQCFSSFAGNPLLISPEPLQQDGLLTADAFKDKPDFPEEKVEYARVTKYKEKLFKKAFEAFEALPSDHLLVEEFEQFKKEQSGWLDDYAMFMAIRKEKEHVWWLEWEKKYRKPTKAQKSVIERDLEPQIRYECFLQWLFFRQWSELKLYANEHGILMIGDIPIFVAADSADVWSQPKMFQLDKDGFPKVVAGVPPDYFSATGQMWGNPLYDWKYHKKTDYSWWMARIKDQLSLSDIVRIDHFRGLESYWEIPAGSENAISGKWAPGPGDDFFLKVREVFGEDIPIIAEDLGIITDDVRALRDRFNLPGMKILQFAFEDDDSAYLPHNHPYNCVCYTGTHDNDTTTGWYATAPEKARDKVRRYMNTDASQVSWDFIRTCFGSVAKYAIIPVQDILCQGSEHRMNIPGIADGNWSYRVRKGLLNDDVARRLLDVTRLYGR
jgi:4-alpha-glucanotransferase